MVKGSPLSIHVGLTPRQEGTSPWATVATASSCEAKSSGFSRSPAGSSSPARTSEIGSMRRRYPQADRSHLFGTGGSLSQRTPNTASGSDGRRQPLLPPKKRVHLNWRDSRGDGAASANDRPAWWAWSRIGPRLRHCGPRRGSRLHRTGWSTNSQRCPVSAPQQLAGGVDCVGRRRRGATFLRPRGPPAPAAQNSEERRGDDCDDEPPATGIATERQG